MTRMGGPNGSECQRVESGSLYTVLQVSQDNRREGSESPPGRGRENTDHILDSISQSMLRKVYIRV